MSTEKEDKIAKMADELKDLVRQVNNLKRLLKAEGCAVYYNDTDETSDGGIYGDISVTITKRVHY